MKVSSYSQVKALLLVFALIVGLATGIYVVLVCRPVDISDAATPDWLNCARIAWRYYSPGTGVHPETGINRAKLDWDAVTDWDVGGYIIATIDAHRLGLMEQDGAWNFKDRIRRVLSYLLSRELAVKDSVKSWPYWAYSWDGRPYSKAGVRYTDSSDSGRLLYALHLLRTYDPSFESQVQDVFRRCRTAYDALSRYVDTRVHYYGILDAIGFTAFGYNKSHVISSFENWAGSFTSVEGQTLPKTITTAEPTLHGILELSLSGNFFEYSRRVYEAQRSRWLNTGLLTGWSEGAYPDPGYIYEWILTTNGESWVIESPEGKRLQINPLMYCKVAFAYLAIFRKNSYTSALYEAARKLEHRQYGFGEATLESGASAISLWGANTKGFYSDKTNQIILAAARYALSSSGPRAVAFENLSESPGLFATSAVTHAGAVKPIRFQASEAADESRTNE